MRILFAEDVPTDAELAEKEIRKSGIEFTSMRVDAKENFLHALEGFQPDLIISDYKMPSFDGMQAMELSKKHDSTIPFIILTGSMNEETAVECIKAGATDYVIKEQIKRLPFAIKEALEQTKLRLANEEAERALRESESSLQAILHSTADGILAVNREMKLLFANERFVEMWMISEKMIVTKDISAILQYIAGQLVDPQNFLLKVRKLYDSTEESFDTLNFKDGRIFERLSRPLMLGAEWRGRVMLFHDVPARNRVEEALRNERLLLRTLIDNLPDAIFVKDTSYRKTLANLADVHNMGLQSEADGLGKRDVEFFPGNIAEKFLADDRSVIETGTPILNREEYLIDAEGRKRWLLTSKLPLRDNDGHIIGLVGIGRDVTEHKQAEETNTLLAQTLISAQDCISISDLNDHILFVNKAFLATYGYDEEDLIGKNIEMLRPSSTSPQQVGKILPSTLKGQWHGELINRRKDGTEFPIELWTSAVHDSEGKPIASVGVARDITERKRSEEALRYERLLLRTLIDNLPDAIYAKDTSSRKTLANLAEVRNMGVKSEAEVLGKDDFDFYPKELAEGFFADDQSVLQTGQPVINRQEYVFDEKGQKRWLLTSKLPLRDKENRIIGLVGVGRNVTERKLAEEALIKSEQQYRDFFEDDLTGDYISTPEGKILSCNPAFVRIFGFTSTEEALNFNANAFYPEPEQREIFLLLLKDKKRLEYYESEYLRSDGRRVYCVENVVGIFDHQENLVQIRGYIFDDSRRRMLEQQLIQAQKLESLGTLASGIAHDFNNILGIIIGYVSLLTREDADPQSIKSSLDAVMKASMRGAALVKQLLTFARKVEVQLQSLQLNDIVYEVSKLLIETMPRTIEITLSLDKDLPMITGDPGQIHQVLLNLGVNARDAMASGGKLTFTTRCCSAETLRARFPDITASEYVKLSVTDTGTGMDKATRSHIFEPFFTTKAIGKGTGLGLSVVFGIMESHKGFIDLESELGKGTTFYLYFPVVRSLGSERAKTEVEKEIPGGTETLLVIEDEDMLRELLRTSLQSAGYTVLTAVDGQEAIDLFEQHRSEIHLVLSDIGLPKLTGFDIFRKMKSMKPDLKFVLASGFIEPQSKSEIFKEGVKDFVQKPYSVYQVLRMVRTILDKT